MQIALLASTAVAQATQVTVADMSWIAGEWVGGEDGTLIEEHWSEPAGDNMMGMFRMLQGDKVVFYEFMSIEGGATGPVLRIKHFHPALKGWEEKDESVVFDLVEHTESRAVFATEIDGDPEQLVFERTGDQLVITLIKPAKDSRSEFRYQRR